MCVTHVACSLCVLLLLELAFPKSLHGWPLSHREGPVSLEETLHASYLSSIGPCQGVINYSGQVVKGVIVFHC